MLLRSTEGSLSSQTVSAGKNLTDHPALPAPSLLASEHLRGEVIFQENRWQSQGWERTPRPPVALSAQPSAPAQVAKAGRPFWQLPAWQGKRRKTCLGAAVVPFILTLQRPLIKIPLVVEREPGGRPDSGSSEQQERAQGGCKRVPGVQPAARASTPSAPVRHPGAPPGPSSSATSGSQMWRASPRCSLAVPGKKEIATQTTRKPTPAPEASQFRESRSPFLAARYF